MSASIRIINIRRLSSSSPACYSSWRSRRGSGYCEKNNAVVAVATTTTQKRSSSSPLLQRHYAALTDHNSHCNHYHSHYRSFSSFDNYGGGFGDRDRGGDRLSSTIRLIRPDNIIAGRRRQRRRRRRGRANKDGGFGVVRPHLVQLKDISKKLSEDDDDDENKNKDYYTLGTSMSPLSTPPQQPLQRKDDDRVLTVFPGDYGVSATWTEEEEDDDDDDDDDDEEEEEEESYDGEFSFAGLDKEEREERRRYKEYLHDKEKYEAARRERWLANNKPPVRVPVIDGETGRAHGRGGRKTASASVWIQPTVSCGLGGPEIVVNGKSFVDYFPRQSDRELVLLPLIITKTLPSSPLLGGNEKGPTPCFDVHGTCRGGGLTGQAGAFCHGLARALNHYNPALYRHDLKAAGLLRRDERKVERKKVGLKKARKAPQWVRR